MRIVLRLLWAATLVAALAGGALAQSYSATLNAAQEVPANASPGSGSAILSLDAAKMLTVHVDFSGLIGTVTASHIHCCAPAGVNAGVKFTLIPPRPATSPIDILVGPLSPADEAALNAGQMYINVHTNQFPGGEIRGQIFQDVVGVESHTWGIAKKLYD